MIPSRFKTCFISAPFGEDTSVLRRALEENSIRWIDHTSLSTGSSWPDAIDSALAKSDFVCVVLPAGQHQNVLFEAGIAYARRKPILAFVGSSANLPSDILSLIYVKTDTKDPDTVRSVLRMFLRHADDKRPRRSQKTPSSHTPKVSATSALPPGPGHEFERKTAELLEGAGFIVSGPAERRDQGADLAVWIDDLESMGNPLLVEVKAGDLSAQRLRDAAWQLREHVTKTHGRCGLLIYWDRQDREFPRVSKEWPLIFQLSGQTLTRLVHEKRLSQELLRLRNAAAHGEV